MALIAQVVEVENNDGLKYRKTVVAVVASASDAREVADAVAAGLKGQIALTASVKHVGPPLTITAS